MPKLKPGIYDNINIDDYHADPAISNSNLKHLKRNPLKFKVQQMLISPDTDAFVLGRAGHAAILEPGKYWKMVAVAPDSVLGKNGTRNTNAYREWAAERPDKTLLTQEQAAMVQGMVESVYENPVHDTARSILKLDDILVEQSIFFEDVEHGFVCKCRPDLRSPSFKMECPMAVST